MRNPYFDIQTVIDLVKEQEPERLDLVEQLERIDKKKMIRRPYISFNYEGKHAKKVDAWDIHESIALLDKNEGHIILDIHKNGKIAGLELTDQIP
ncbi:MAG: hypothetical protein P8100_04020 [bacterium]|jgi:uncharacterized protein YuzE